MSIQSHTRPLILSSGSPYRQELLARLCLPFTTQAPRIDETPFPGESAAALAQRLARMKAEEIAASFPDAVVIGCDQVAECAGQLVGKPGSADQAVAQLMGFSGRSVNFLTATAVLCKASGFSQTHTDFTCVTFRELQESEVRRYVALDMPLDCAGSFKSEAAGPVLMKSLQSNDPTAIVGLPLIGLANMLRAAGFRLP